MRQFNLTNANGQVFDLMRKDAFFNTPEGLGWGVTDTIMQVDKAYIVTESVPNTPAPAGEMLFAGYEQYNEFLAFAQCGGLVLGYKPLDTWLYLDVSLVISKGEISPSTRRLHCDIDFTAHSDWYERLVAYQAQASEGGKTYGYKYPYTYTSSAAGTVEIQNGNLESYPRITIFGPVQNPTWALYQNGNRLQTGTMDITIPTGNKLVIDADPASMEIAEYTNGGALVANRYGNSDFTTARIFMLPPGPCSMVFTQEGVGTVDAYVEVRKRV